MSEPMPSGLRDGLEGSADKQELVDWIFRRVADRYDLGNDIMSLGWHARWKQRLMDYVDIQPEFRVLDLACGTGDITWAVAQRAYEGEVIGTDICPEMMVHAEPKRPAGVSNVRFVEADAAALPFEDNSFDLVTCAYAGRGFPDFPGVVQEAFRVLKPGGHFWNLDFARPQLKPWDKLYRGYMMASGAVLGTVLHGHPKTYMYIPASMRAYRGQHWLDGLMRDAGFETEVIETLGTLMAYNHGQKPA